MLDRDRYKLIFLAAMLVTIAGTLLIGCNRSGTADQATASGANVVVTPSLLPTPTLAPPINFDPLRPPTPIIQPSPTQQTDGQTDSPSKAVEADLDALPSVQSSEQPATTLTLPEGATSAEILALARQAVLEGDQATAAVAFRAVVDNPGELDDDHIAEARLGLAVAMLSQGQYDAAALELESLLLTPRTSTLVAGENGLVTGVVISDAAAFHLGRARAALGDLPGAIDAYTVYLDNNPEMAAYIQPIIADAHQTLGNTEGVIGALEGAVDAPAERFKAVANRSRLASLYLARGEYAAAIEQYDAIHEIAQTEITKGQMTFLAGQAEMQAGNTAAAYERYQYAITNYPRANDSYQALVALLDAGIAVDEYQRGVVDYFAGAYLPGIDAFRRYIAAAKGDYRTDAHVYIAWSLERLGDIENALIELDTLAELDPETALFERGELLRRAGRRDEALSAYDTYLENHGESERAALVAWAAAVAAQEAGKTDAAERYQFLADTYPFSDNAPRALFIAAELLDAMGQDGEALALRRRLIEQYPANGYAAEALFRLILAAENGEVQGVEPAELAGQVETLTPSNYFALRAADLVTGTPPFSAGDPMSATQDAEAGRVEAEAWLRRRLSSAGTAVPEGDLGSLSSDLAADPRRIIGEKLWQLGLQQEAKNELETLRESYAGDALANYRLARYFAELGLYRSSIISAAALLRQLNATVFDAPGYLGRLSYPIYFSELIFPLAERYGFDPRLQFALVRQESLFESFARSGAAAQGLSQVIPDTGAWIAQRLAWPNFENEDLYKPYIGLNFGAYYLSEQLRNFDGHVHAALAAYNGGPGNAARWFATAGGNHDLFVDTVDFPETRLYIERIYEGFNAYRHLYDSP